MSIPEGGTILKQFDVTGMSCAACSARVEKAVSHVPGVTACAVSLLTNSMGVEGTAPDQAIIDAVQAAGYGASVQGGQTPTAPDGDALADHETPRLRRRLCWSLGFLLILMYFSMGHMMWGWPLPGFYDGNHVAMGLTQLLLTVVIMVINQKFFISGYKALWHRAPNMDTLVALGAAAAFVYSTYALFAMTGAQVRGDAQAVMGYMHDFYFESAAMILTLITVGKTLEARAKGKTTDALRSLLQLAPKTATVERGGAELTVPIEQVRLGDVFLVRPGERIPVDGVVLDGTSAVNEAALTGESIPADKAPGAAVSAATVNQSGCKFNLRKPKSEKEPVRLSQMPRHARRRGHDPCADHPHGARRGGDESADRQDRGQGVRRVRAGGHGRRVRDVSCLAAAGPQRGLRARARHLGAGHQLPVRARPRHAGGDHGRQRRGREKRRPVQDGGLP